MDLLDELLHLTRQLRLIDPRDQLRPVRWRPAADVVRTREGWCVKLELAGVRPADVEISLAGRFLRITGRRCDRELAEGCEFWSMEIAYSTFERLIELPSRVDRARIDAEARDGMLLVRVILPTDAAEGRE